MKVFRIPIGEMAFPAVNPDETVDQFIERLGTGGLVFNEKDLAAFRVMTIVSDVESLDVLQARNEPAV